MTTTDVIREVRDDLYGDDWPYRAEYAVFLGQRQQPEPTRGNLCDRCLRGTVTDPTTDWLCPECYADLTDADDDAPADAD